MSKCVMIVHLEVKPEGVDTFLQAAKRQAELSVSLEPGCHRFDIVTHAESNNKFSHYEIFEDADAFEAHTRMPHTAEFAKAVEALIVNTEVRRGPLMISFGQ